MVNNEIKFTRVPIKNAVCGDCKRPVSWGVWAHYQESTGEVVCQSCGLKRGWQEKDIANYILKKRELQEDLKALRSRIKIEGDALYLLTEKVDLTRFGERYLDLERQIHKSLDSVQSFIEKVATPEEKTALRKVYDVTDETRQVQKEIKEELDMRLFLIQRAERKKKHLEKIIDVEEERKTAEEEDQAFNASMAQIKEEAMQRA